MKSGLGSLFFALVLVVAALSLLSSSASVLPDLPYRWVLVRNWLRDDKDIEKIREIARTASEHGLNGILLGSHFETLTLQPPGFHRRLKAVRDLCKGFKLDLIPSVMVTGYGQGILEHAPNLAEGLPVKDALFVVSQGRASLVADPPIQLLNGGFEEDGVRALPGFSISAPFGSSAVLDREERASGSTSLRLQGFGSQPSESIRLSQQIKVQPYRLYRISCWVRSRNLKPSEPFGESGFQLEVYGGKERRPLQYENPILASNDDWHLVTVAFNSWQYDQVEISPLVKGGGSGRFWIDDLRVDEIGLVNVLRRPGTPLTVKNDAGGTEYREGTDFEPVRDPLMDFHFDHPGPAIRILPGGRIREGERLRVSYFHSVFIYNDQVPVCLAEPGLYQLWEEQARRIHAELSPRYYFLGADEHRALGTCQACRNSGKTLGELQADSVSRQFRTIREINPDAEVFVWSDMFDPNHNAGDSRPWYYLTDGSFAGSWLSLPRELHMVCWYFERREASLKHFSSLGFRTLAGAYYDADNLENPRLWLESMARTPGAEGIIYTTWLDKYELLGPFGDLVSGRKH